VTDQLVKAGSEKIAYVGTSRGAEAALLAAIEDPRIDAVVAQEHRELSEGTKHPNPTDHD
jgi:hypothetical protein